MPPGNCLFYSATHTGYSLRRVTSLALRHRFALPTTGPRSSAHQLAVGDLHEGASVVAQRQVLCGHNILNPQLSGAAGYRAVDDARPPAGVMEYHIGTVAQ